MIKAAERREQGGLQRLPGREALQTQAQDVMTGATGRRLSQGKVRGKCVPVWV